MAISHPIFSSIGGRQIHYQFVNDILAKFLTSAHVLYGVGSTESIFFERHKIFFTPFDRSTNAIVPGGVTVFHYFGQTAIGANRGCTLQSTGECIHAPEVGIEKVNRLEALTPNFCIEIKSTRREP